MEKQPRMRLSVLGLQGVVELPEVQDSVRREKLLNKKLLRR